MVSFLCYRATNLQGYVNVSIQVISPGDTIKAPPKKDDTEIDIASNVFFPPGQTSSYKNLIWLMTSFITF